MSEVVVEQYPSRRETVEAKLNDEVLVRAVRVDSNEAQQYGVDEYRAYWLVAFPGANRIVGHEIGPLYYPFEDLNPLTIGGLASLIEKAGAK